MHLLAIKQLEKDRAWLIHRINKASARKPPPPKRFKRGGENITQGGARRKHRTYTWYHYLDDMVDTLLKTQPLCKAAQQSLTKKEVKPETTKFLPKSIL